MLAAPVPAPPLPVLAAPWSARAARPDAGDPELLQAWMARPHVAEFWRQAWSAAEWTRELHRQLAGDHSVPLLVDSGGVPVAYLEVYRVLRDRLAGHYSWHPHDLGVHIAIGEPSRTGRGLGRALLRAVAGALLVADPKCPRVVAEPDVRNAHSVRAFTAAGFRAAGEVTLPDKVAALLVFDRDQDDPTPEEAP
jgi:RimJ/RimL family protein N-acetyltransferase